MCPRGAGWGPAGRCSSIRFVEPFGKRSDDSLEEKTRLSVLESGSLEVGTAPVGFVMSPNVMSPNVDPTAPHSASGNMQTLPSPPALNPVSDIWGSCVRCRAVVSNVWSPDPLGQHLLGTSEAQRAASRGLRYPPAPGSEAPSASRICPGPSSSGFLCELALVFVILATNS